MIHAKIDVKLHSHPKARKAGSAMATWAWALCYIRDHQTDGFISDAMIGAAWPGETQARKDAAKLVAVGLWEVVEPGAGPDGDGGWRLCKYEEKNDTRAQIEARLADDRARKKTSSKKTPSGIQPEGKSESAGFPDSLSDSPSDSGLESRSKEPDPARATPANDDAVPPVPDWWAGACMTAHQSTGITVDDPVARWGEYDVSRQRLGWARNHRDAVGYLTKVLRSEKQQAPKRKIDTRQPLMGPEPEWLTRAKATGTDGTEPF
jgi:hypothetical protein